MRRRGAPFFALLCTSIGLSAAVVDSDAAVLNDLRTVVLAGQTPVNVPASITFNDVGSPQIDNNGLVSFGVRLADPSASVPVGAFGIESSGGLRVVVRPGQPAPGYPPEQPFASQYGAPITSRGGQTAFRGRVVSPPGPPNQQPPQPPPSTQGVWINRTGDTLELVARQGGPAMGAVPDQLIGAILDKPAVNSVGDVAFAAELSGPGTTPIANQGIWLWRNGGLQLAARRGESTASGTVGVIQSPLALNSAGVIAFYSTTGIWKSDPVNGLSSVALHGQPAYGFPAGTNIHVLRAPLINADGSLVYQGITRLGASDDHYAIWGDANGVRRLVASEGQQAPGAAAGSFFNDVFESNPAIDKMGRATFHASLLGPAVNADNSEGIWTESFGNGLQLVARTGDQAPGLDSGVVFSNLRHNSRNVNGMGQIAFLAKLSGPGVDSSNDYGIWATDLAGSLQLIAREGDQIDLSVGVGVDMRTITSLNFQYGLGNDSGGASSFNDRGQFAFGVGFSDGSSGIFVTNAVAVPEPSSAAMALLTITPGLIWRRRRCACC